jgi:hypothetical protein
MANVTATRADLDNTIAEALRFPFTRPIMTDVLANLYRF